jgi:hypothetical protein
MGGCSLKRGGLYMRDGRREGIFGEDELFFVAFFLRGGPPLKGRNR